MSQTPIQQKIRNKTITAKKWAEMVKDGDWFYMGGPGGDPVVTIEALCQRLGDGHGQVKNIEIFQVAKSLGGNFFLQYDPEAKWHVVHEEFMMPKMIGPTSFSQARDKGYKGMDTMQMGWAIGMNHRFARWYRKEKKERAIDWGVQPIAKPEGNFVNASYGVNNWMIAAKTCKKFVCEIRDDYAWCTGGRNHVLPIDEVDYFIEVDTKDPKYQWPKINERAIKPNAIQQEIAKHVLSIMRDGDCIQVGIGVLPTAIVVALEDSNLRHLGAHSEMGGEYIFRLTEAGVMDNSRKNIDRGRAAWSYIIPVDMPRYMEWLNHNPYFAAYDINYVNNFTSLAAIDNMVTINNFAEIDVTGIVCSSKIGDYQFASTGGQFQFHVGGNMSRGGRGILAATSRAKNGASRIVPRLQAGSNCEIPGQLTGWVCTEYGIVNLMGCSDAEKSRLLISIAHPDDRESLEKEAFGRGLKTRHWMFNVAPDRRYPSADELKDHKFAYNDLITVPNSLGGIGD
jgi:acyl-CoA hydrolase